MTTLMLRRKYIYVDDLLIRQLENNLTKGISVKTIMWFYKVFSFFFTFILNFAFACYVKSNCVSCSNVSEKHLNKQSKPE